MKESPSTNGSNGRDIGGRFVKGNAGGPGNPQAQRVARLRSAMYEAVTAEDLKDVVSALLDAGKAGDVSAAKELLQRLLGPPVQLDLVERLESLEQRIAELQQRNAA